MHRIERHSGLYHIALLLSLHLAITCSEAQLASSSDVPCTQPDGTLVNPAKFVSQIPARIARCIKCECLTGIVKCGSTQCHQMINNNEPTSISQHQKLVPKTRQPIGSIILSSTTTTTIATTTTPKPTTTRKPQKMTWHEIVHITIGPDFTPNPDFDIPDKDDDDDEDPKTTTTITTTTSVPSQHMEDSSFDSEMDQPEQKVDATDSPIIEPETTTTRPTTTTTTTSIPPSVISTTTSILRPSYKDSKHTISSAYRKPAKLTDKQPHKAMDQTTKRGFELLKTSQLYDESLTATESEFSNQLTYQQLKVEPLMQVSTKMQYLKTLFQDAHILLATIVFAILILVAYAIFVNTMEDISIKNKRKFLVENYCPKDPMYPNYTIPYE